MKRATSLENQLSESLATIRASTDQEPRVGVILGSGLGSFADTLEGLEKIPTESIPHFPKSTVDGHHGFLVFGKLEGVPILAVQGRTHVYEGHPVEKVAYVVRVMAALGVQKLLVTNAAGGINPQFRPGDLMIIVDHINFLFRNPLRGPVFQDEPRFPDMYGNYHPPFIEMIERVGLEEGIPLRKGVLFVSTGPSYETAAEVRMIRCLGGDAASMSTVPEVLVARARGIKVAGISCITNLATGLSATPLSHEEVTEIAGQVQEKFRRLVRRVLVEMDRLD